MAPTRQQKDAGASATPTKTEPAADVAQPIYAPMRAPLWSAATNAWPRTGLAMRKEGNDAAGAPTETKKPDDKKEAGDIAFGSVGLPWLALRPLVLKLPSRWRTFAEKSRDDLNKDDEELLYNTTAALQNLIWAGIHTELSGYKPSWSKSLKTVENLSGVSDTYLHLISFAVQRDLEKYLSEDISNVYTENLGWLIIYGALLQGGLVGLNAAMDEDLDFTSLLKPATAKWTEAPSGFKRPFQLSNIPDERWSKYPFWSSPEGFESKLTGFGDPTKPYAFTLNLGLNIASMADLYPEDEKEKEKYKGLEAYPYFKLKHEWAQGDVQPEAKTTWLLGGFIGTNGFYTLLEGGRSTRPDDTRAESYVRQAFMGRNLGRLSLLQLSHEYSFRSDQDPDIRARLNAAAQIRLIDRRAWEATIGAGIGGLLPAGGQTGAFDASGALSLHHKYYQEKGEDEEPFKSGVTLGSMWRPQDPFRAESPRLFGITGKLSVLDMVILSVEHHRFAAESGVPADPALPTQDTRFMLMFGPGIFRWK